MVSEEEEAEVAKVIAKETKRPVPANQGSFIGQTRKAPYQRRGTNRSPRSPPDRKCWVCGKADIPHVFARTSIKECAVSESDLFCNGILDCLCFAINDNKM